MVTDINSLTINDLYSYADYLSWQFQERVEIIKGKIFKMSPGPNLEHQRVSMNIAGPLYIHLKGKPCSVFSAPFDVRLPKNPKSKKDQQVFTVVQPDICVICDPKKLDQRGCLGAPDLIIEILSPSTAKKDLNEKFNIYEKCGVTEYWIVFPHEQEIQIYTLNKDKNYELSGHYYAKDSIPSSVLKGFVLDLKEVFKEPIV